MTSILDKIRKLRALSQSSNVNEAAAAAAAAERLIQEHNLSEAALHVEGAADDEVTNENALDLGSTIVAWQSNLIVHLMRAYQISGFYETSRSDGARSKSFVAYGRKEDIDTLRYQFAFFTAEVTRLAERTKGQGRTFANSFRLGAVAAIGEALQSARQATRSGATSSALVVVDRRAELAKEAMNAAHPKLRKRQASSSRLDGRAYDLGKKAGAGIHQSAQITTSGARLLGS